MAKPKRLRRAVPRGVLAGCCAVAVSLLLATQASAVVTITVETTDGVQGGDLTLTMSMTRAGGDPEVAGAQTDLIFDTSQMEIVGTCASGGAPCQGSADCAVDGICDLPCVKHPRLAEQGFTANLPVTVRPPDPEGRRRLRLAVFPDVSSPTATFDSGGLISCTFHVQPDATPDVEVFLTSDRLVVGDASDNTVDGVQIQLIRGVIRMATPTPTPTATPTATPTIPCFVDQDCPRGQVCEAGVCRPAPTPTPTIACPDGICPDGLTCVDGICRDLSTPTPTPTPLPPCMTNDDCLPGFHCRAKVCVPIRECDDSDPEVGRRNCRGVRETCTNNVCECGGDCSLDGFVFGNETSVMVCLLSGECQLTDCPAGDFDGDGQVTGSEVCQAVTNLGLGCPAEGQPLGIDRTQEIRSLDIGSATGVAGAEVTVGISLSGGGEVATAQMDLLIDTNVLEVDAPNPRCSVDPRLAATETTFTFLPQTPGTPPGIARLRIFVGNTDLCKADPPFPLTSFDTGGLVSCIFRIDPSAQPGTYQLTAERLNVGDPRGNEFGAEFSPGSVTVEPPPPCTTDAECPGGTHCRAGECKGIRQCSGPMAGPGECRDGRETCTDQVCECGADCNRDGRVRNNEVTAVANIFTGQAEVVECPAADENGDGRVRNNEVTVTAINFTQGCP